MYCRQCGSQIKDGSAFCPKCGAAQRVTARAGAGRSPHVATRIGAPKPKLPVKTIALVAACAAAIALVAFVIVPSISKLLQHHGASQQAAPGEHAGTVASSTNDPSDSANTEESADSQSGAAVLQLGATDDFDYSKIKLGEVKRTDDTESLHYGGLQTTFEWTVTNTSDESCPVVALNVSWDRSGVTEDGYRDGKEIYTNPSSLDDEFTINGDGSLRDWDYNSIRDFTYNEFGQYQGWGWECTQVMGLGVDLVAINGSARACIYELAPGETRSVWLNPVSDGFVDDEKTVYATDNLAVEVDPTNSYAVAQELRGSRARKVLPQDWNIGDPNTADLAESGKFTITLTNTTDYRVKKATVYFVPLDAKSMPRYMQTCHVSTEQLEPGETRTLTCSGGRRDAGFLIEFVDTEFE